jgi:hypothetical protein
MAGSQAAFASGGHPFPGREREREREKERETERERGGNTRKKEREEEELGKSYVVICQIIPKEKTQTVKKPEKYLKKISFLFFLLFICYARYSLIFHLQ